MEDLAKVGGAIVAVVIVAVAAFTYLTAEQQTVPVTGREQRVAMSEEEQAEIGRQAFAEVLAAEGGVVTSGPEAEMVRRVGSRIAEVSDDPGFDWEFALIESALVNAFCLPGGKVAVYSGLLRVAESEAGLAAVLAHEVAHAVAQHGAERALQQELAQSVGNAIAVGLSDAAPEQRAAVLALFGASAQLGVLLPFSREHESEADRIGLLYMARAGYDPREAIGLWQRMAEAQSQPQPPEYASTHPSHERRIADLERWLPEALEEYEQARAGRMLDPLLPHANRQATRGRQSRAKVAAAT